MITLIERRIKEGKLDDSKSEALQKELRRYSRKLREWTPLLKWWAGERSFVFARNAVQIHGGYGFTKNTKRNGGFEKFNHRYLRRYF